MGNSHGSNTATASRTASAAAQQSSQPTPTPAPTSASGGARLTEEQAQRAVSITQRAVASATRAYNTAQERARRAGDEAIRLRNRQFDFEARNAQHAADLRRAIREGAQSHPDLVGRVGDARRTVQEQVREGRRQMAQAGRLQARLNRNPNDAETRTALRQLQREIGRSQSAVGLAALRQGEAEQALIRATLGNDEQSRIADAEARANRASGAAIAANARLNDANRSLEDALVELDLARGGTGVRGNADALALATASGLFNRQMTTDDFAKMVGARAGDRLQVTGSGTTVGLSLNGGGREATMSFTRANDGKLTAHVGWATTIRGAHAQRSIGNGRDLIRSMQAMHDFGVQRVQATAGGYGHGAGGRLGSGMNGFYTWARMGFTGALDSSTARAASSHFGTSLRTVQSVMQQRGGAQWWKANGNQFEATFNWSNSYSRSTFERFAAAVNRGATT